MGIFDNESLLEFVSDTLSDDGAGGLFVCKGLWALLLSLLGVPIMGDRVVGFAIFVLLGRV